MGKDYKNILVAVDGSDAAVVALKKSIEIAIKDQAKLFITHVIDTRAFIVTMEIYDRVVIDRAEAFARELLEQYKTEAKAAGVANVETILEFGSPKTKIPKDIAKKYNVDLIITGATGLNAVERLLIGSVSDAIIRNATCDVLVVRH